MLIQVKAFSQGSLRYGGLIHKACVLISPQSAGNASQMSSFQLFPPCLILSDRIDSSYLFVHWRDETQTAVVFSTYIGCVWCDFFIFLVSPCSNTRVVEINQAGMQQRGPSKHPEYLSVRSLLFAYQNTATLYDTTWKTLLVQSGYDLTVWSLNC